MIRYFFLFFLSVRAFAYLQVVPATSLYDESLFIRAWGFEPHQQIVIRSHLVDARGESWSAWALFEADRLGNVEVDRSVPCEGTYRGADSMGLIWSMTPDSGKSTLFRGDGEKMQLEFSLEVEGKTVDRVEIERKMEDLQRVSVRENGLVGTLFLPPSEEPLPVVITLSGSGGGLKESRAQAIASHGFAALALAYFGCEGLPKNLEEIPLEYLETAIEWLEKQSSIDSKQIGIWGVSRGGELALLLGATFPDKVKAIAAYVPSSVLYGSIAQNGKPAWTYRGKPVASNAPFPARAFAAEGGETVEKAIALTPFFLEGMQDRETFAAAAIPVEKIQCPLLLVSGQDDQMWPSSVFAEQIVQRLKEKRSAISCTHLKYPGAGHFISPPYIPTTSLAELHPIAKRWFAFGGNPEDTAFARADSWEKTVQFFKKHLCLY